ncbi:MAG: T9SS type A sorting domain-containing protein [Bacteroidales bacterium]|nr:T9SS type A sorting domain-containing protein [Bacteroidales bacterium]MCF8403417.1 T9SS type A sorting domain-containing protein [Bacteroidales bacterium]
MKKITCGLIFSLFIFTFTYGQINLEHTFNSSGFGTWHFNTDTETFYYNANVNTNKLFIYSDDYSIYKTVNFNPPAGYELYWIYYPSKYLFNDDEWIEFILVFSNSTNYQMKIYNENMSLVKDLGAGNNAYVIKTYDGSFKLKTSDYVYNAATQTIDYTDKIFSIPGELYVSDLGINDVENTQKAYPNPSKERIILPYTLNPDEISTLHIYNLQGQLIESKNIHGSFDHLYLDVSTYEPGGYVYSYKQVKATFIVK